MIAGASRKKNTFLVIYMSSLKDGSELHLFYFILFSSVESEEMNIDLHQRRPRWLRPWLQKGFQRSSRECFSRVLVSNFRLSSPIGSRREWWEQRRWWGTQASSMPLVVTRRSLRKLSWNFLLKHSPGGVGQSKIDEARELHLCSDLWSSSRAHRRARLRRWLWTRATFLRWTSFGGRTMSSREDRRFNHSHGVHSRWKTTRYPCVSKAIQHQPPVQVANCL